MFHNCKVLMGIHGAGLTNMMFMNRNSSIIELLPSGQQETYQLHYFKLASILNHSYTYILNSRIESGERPHKAKIHVDLDELKGHLDQICR